MRIIRAEFPAEPIVVLRIVLEVPSESIEGRSIYRRYLWKPNRDPGR